MRASATARGYNRRWQNARASYLKANPWCVMCRQQGRLTRAVHVDHISPHKGDPVLFWNSANWQALCPPCHNGAKQKQEKRGYVVGSDQAGVPLDPKHHWNTKP